MYIGVYLHFYVGVHIYIFLGGGGPGGVPLSHSLSLCIYIYTEREREWNATRSPKIRGFKRFLTILCFLNVEKRGPDSVPFWIYIYIYRKVRCQVRRFPRFWKCSVFATSCSVLYVHIPVLVLLEIHTDCQTSSEVANECPESHEDSQGKGRRKNKHSVCVYIYIYGFP